MILEGSKYQLEERRGSESTGWNLTYSFLPWTRSYSFKVDIKEETVSSSIYQPILYLFIYPPCVCMYMSMWVWVCVCHSIHVGIRASLWMSITAFHLEMWAFDVCCPECQDRWTTSFDFSCLHISLMSPRVMDLHWCVKPCMGPGESEIWSSRLHHQYIFP